MRAWLKMRVDLARDPRTIRLARAMGFSDARQAVGYLLDVWGWFMSSSEDGTVQLGNDRRDVEDTLASAWGHPHLAPSMEHVGWLSITDDGAVVMPGFEKWTRSMDEIEAGQEAKREMWREQKRQQREAAKCPQKKERMSADMSTDNSAEVRGLSSSLISSSSFSGTSEEEESPKRKPARSSRISLQDARDLPLPPQIAHTRAEWHRWVEHLWERKRPTRSALEAQAGKLAKVPDLAESILEDCRASNAQGIPAWVVKKAQADAENGGARAAPRSFSQIAADERMEAQRRLEREIREAEAREGVLRGGGLLQ